MSSPIDVLRRYAHLAATMEGIVDELDALKPEIRRILAETGPQTVEGRTWSLGAPATRVRYATVTACSVLSLTELRAALPEYVQLAEPVLKLLSPARRAKLDEGRSESTSEPSIRSKR